MVTESRHGAFLHISCWEAYQKNESSCSIDLQLCSQREGGGRNESCFSEPLRRASSVFVKGIPTTVAIVPRFLLIRGSVHSGTAFCTVLLLVKISRLDLRTAQWRLCSFAMFCWKANGAAFWLLYIWSGVLVTSRGKLALTGFRALKA